MPKLEFVEKSICKVEGFTVRFRHATPGTAKGRDVRGDKSNLPSYSYQRIAAGTQTVAAWIGTRFAKSYPGFAVEVLDGSGKKARQDPALHSPQLVRRSQLDDCSIFRRTLRSQARSA